MKRSGIEFGSHTVQHSLLTDLPPELQLEELRASKRQLEKATGASVDCLAYPGGDFDLTTERCAAQAGYTLAFSTIPGVNQPGMPLTALRRTEVSASDSLFVFRAKMAGALDWLSFKESRALRRLIGRLNDLMLPLAQGWHARDG